MLTQPAHALAAAVCLLAAQRTIAQSYTTNPPGWESAEYAGEKGFAQLLGRYANQRLQWAVSGLPQKAMTITAMDFRRDGLHWSDGSLEFGEVGGHARSWTRVTIGLGETTVTGTSFSTTFTQNIKGAYATVFTGKVTWANAASKPTTQTRQWGAGGLSFPFATPYSWSGKDTLLTDFEMAGGALANRSWSTPNSYFLEGVHTEDYLYGRISQFVFPKCVDGSQKVAPTAWLNTDVYSNRARNRANDGAIFYDFRVANVAPNRGLVYAVGPEGSLSPTVQPGKLFPQDIGACNLLWIGIHKAVLAYPVADSLGNWRLQGRLGPAYNFVLGTQLFTQAAYQDSKKGTFSLTGVGLAHIHRRPPDPQYDGNQLLSPAIGPNGHITGFVEGIGLPLSRLTLK